MLKKKVMQNIQYIYSFFIYYNDLFYLWPSLFLPPLIFRGLPLEVPANSDLYFSQIWHPLGEMHFISPKCALFAASRYNGFMPCFFKMLSFSQNFLVWFSMDDCHKLSRRRLRKALKKNLSKIWFKAQIDLKTESPAVTPKVDYQLAIRKY